MYYRRSMSCRPHLSALRAIFALTCPEFLYPFTSSHCHSLVTQPAGISPLHQCISAARGVAPFFWDHGTALTWSAANRPSTIDIGENAYIFGLPVYTSHSPTSPHQTVQPASPQTTRPRGLAAAPDAVFLFLRFHPAREDAQLAIKKGIKSHMATRARPNRMDPRAHVHPRFLFSPDWPPLAVTPDCLADGWRLLRPSPHHPPSLW